MEMFFRLKNVSRKWALPKIGGFAENDTMFLYRERK